jgi:hypothetical protein
MLPGDQYPTPFIPARRKLNDEERKSPRYLEEAESEISRRSFEDDFLVPRHKQHRYLDEANYPVRRVGPVQNDICIRCYPGAGGRK